jgi:hypothetical protein
VEQDCEDARRPPEYAAPRSNMSNITNGDIGPLDDLFDSSARTRIAQLALGQPDSQSSAYVEAEVCLLWPYSSKTGELSLLLADPDVRLRSAKGQLKVTFHGSGARGVAKSQVGIGDNVRLHLAQAEWTNTGDSVSTPGKKVDWDLHLKNQVILDVRRNGTHLATVNYEKAPTPPPTPKAVVDPKNKSLQINRFQGDFEIAYSTPTSGKSNRLSSVSFIDASLDPFADDDGFVVGKGRKRTKFGRTSGSWRLVDDGDDREREEEESANPEDTTATRNEAQLPTMHTNDVSDVIILDDSTSPQMSPVNASMPPLTPFRRPEKLREDIPESENATTLRLHPLLSPGLPLVSPPVKDVGESVGYFGVQPSASSELDAISISSTSPHEVAFPTEADSGKTGADEDSKPRVQAVEDAKVQFLEAQPRSAPSDFNILPSPTFDDSFGLQSQVFGNVTTASPFRSALGSFAGFGTLPPAQSSFEAPQTSFDSPTGFASSSNSFGSSPTTGFGLGVGFGFGAPSLSASENPFALKSTQLGSQNVFGASRPKGTEKDDSLASEIAAGFDNVDPTTANEPQIQSPVVQHDLERFRRERSQSEQTEDDDMYGPARPVQRSASVASVSSGKSRSLQRDWQDSLDVTAVATKTGKLPSPPFPFVQNWHKKGAKSRRSSQHSQFLDGASDEISENEESQSRPNTATSSEEGLLHMSSDGDQMTELVQPADLEVTELGLPIDVEVVQNFESVTRAQITVGPMVELEDVPAQRQTEQTDTVHVVDDDQISEELAIIRPGQDDPSTMHTTTEHHTMEELADEDGQLKDQNQSSLAMRELLLTPNNTQQDLTEAPCLESIQQVPSLQMPPTPDNTQEPPARAEILQFDGINDLHSIGPRQSDKEVLLLEAERNENLPSRSHRKSLDVQAVSSPYFTSRWSPRLSPERQTIAIDRSKLQGDENAPLPIPGLEQSVPEELHATHKEVLGSQRYKRHHSTLGMVTPLSYYTPLPNLFEHFGQQVDVLAMCTSNSGEPTRSKTGPKDYNVTIHLADSFLDGATTITAQVFRPYKRALLAAERGQAVLLRAFKVQSQKRKTMLLSTDSSAWAVFSASGAAAKEVEAYELQVNSTGPPVEYGSEEQVYAKKLMGWWNSEGAAAHPVMATKQGDNYVEDLYSENHNRKNGTNGPAEISRGTRSSRRTNNRTDNMENDGAQSPVFEPTSPKPTPRPRRKMNRTDNDANGHDHAEVISSPSSPTRSTRSSRRLGNSTDNAGNSKGPDTADTTEPLPEIMPSPKVSRHPRRSTSVISATPEPSRSLRSQSIVHELRDGTRYVDGHVPTRKDGVHELRDGTNYVDRMPSKSPEVRRSARTKGSRSVVHELRDGAKYVDE